MAAALLGVSEDELQEQKRRREQEKVHCPKCGTTVWKETVEDAIETQESHDERAHDGERVTKVNGMVPPEFTEEQQQAIQDAIEQFKSASRTNSEGDDAET
jgi:hypothetical protein